MNGQTDQSKNVMNGQTDLSKNVMNGHQSDPKSVWKTKAATRPRIVSSAWDWFLKAPFRAIDRQLLKCATRPFQHHSRREILPPVKARWPAQECKISQQQPRNWCRPQRHAHRRCLSPAKLQPRGCTRHASDAGADCSANMQAPRSCSTTLK
jgi:hypothetical protein